MSLKLECTLTNVLTGETLCSEDFGMIRKIILCNETTEFDTDADAQTLQNWTDRITGVTTPKIFPFPVIVNVEDNSTEPIIEEVSRYENIYISNGEVIMTVRLNKNVSEGLLQNLLAFNGKKPYLVIATDNGYIRAKSDDKIKFQFIETTRFYVSKTEDTATTSKYVSITFGVTKDDLHAKGSWIKPTAFNPISDIKGIVQIVGAINTATTTGITFTLSGAFDSRVIVGSPALDLADFTLDATLTSEVDTLTNNNDGTYTLAPTTTFTTGVRSIALKSPAITGQLIAMPTTITLTVS